MLSFIVFKVECNLYAINLELIQRIVEASKCKRIPNSSPVLDGVISFEGDVIKILNYRQMVGLQTLESLECEMFRGFKQEVVDLYERFDEIIQSKNELLLCSNAHNFQVGKWIDSFKSYSDTIVNAVTELSLLNKEFHGFFEKAHSDSKFSKEEIAETLETTKNAILEKISHLEDNVDSVCNALQKYLIYSDGMKKFAVKIDSVRDIIHIEKNKIINNDSHENVGSNLELNGVIDIDGELITIVRSISLPEGE